RFLLKERTFFQENPSVREAFLNRLFYLDEMNFEVDDNLLKVLALAPEGWDGWLEPEVWETLRPLVSGKSLSELRPFFEILKAAMPRWRNPVEGLEFLRRWIRLHETLAKRKALKAFFNELKDKEYLLGQSAPVTNTAMPDARL